MFQRIYTFFIEPQQKDEDLRNRELVLNVLLLGTLLLLACGVALLILAYVGFHHTYVLPRMVGISTALVATWWIYFLSRSGRHRAAPWFLIAVYLLLATGVSARWGVSLPSAVLLFGMVIMLTGTVLGARYPMYVAAASVIIVLILDTLQSQGVIKPDLTWMQQPYDLGTVIGFCLIFGVIAAISWLFNERTEHSLHRAHRAEAGLRRQKLLLESKVEERTRELQDAQLEKIQQLYRFAELGQLSTALLHDLANHLTTLTLDIEGLETENHSHILKRAKRSIRYIDNMVLRVRDQLHGKMHIRPFNVETETNEVMTIMTHRASEAHVTLTWEAVSDKKELVCRGEPIRFRQLMANMIANGIDAYEGIDRERREVHVTLEAVGGTIIVTVTDWGKGINADVREKLFEPFYSTKKTGMGMGLFIARQIAEEQFRGGISLDNATEHTAFIITLAKA
ncbi:MAG TPA: ATP-binding protein [Patescibacteria group bacterium]|nr:ATP-binding protein [Patescibacteria group bacterium]